VIDSGAQIQGRSISPGRARAGDRMV
jgi:hypothetical protein